VHVELGTTVTQLSGGFQNENIIKDFEEGLENSLYQTESNKSKRLVADDLLSSHDSKPKPTCLYTIIKMRIVGEPTLLSQAAYYVLTSRTRWHRLTDIYGNSASA
jgi:hypothetical protein